MTGRKDLWIALTDLKKAGRIKPKEFKVYRGQILNGDEEGAIRGLKRKGLIKEVED